MHRPETPAAASLWAFLGRAILPLLVLGITACGGPQVKWPPPPSGLAWPMPPAPPRVRHLGAFRCEADLGIGPRGLARLWAWIAAAEDLPLVHPANIEVANDGEIWVVDTATRIVHAFHPEGNGHRRLEGTREQPLVSPIDVALGPDGKVYVSDSYQQLVLAYDEDLDFARQIGARILQRPTGLACDPGSGTLYVADTLQGSIAVFGPEGRLQRWIGRPGKEPGQLHFPTHLALRNGRLYVTDALNFRVQVFTLDGTLLGAIGAAGDGPGTFSRPKGLAVDADGHLYVVDSLFDNVQVFDPGGQLLLAFGRTGSGDGELYLPGGLAIDQRGLIYAADVYNGRVQVFEYVSLEKEAP